MTRLHGNTKIISDKLLQLIKMFCKLAGYIISLCVCVCVCVCVYHSNQKGILKSNISNPTKSEKYIAKEGKDYQRLLHR
jgi:hypothetical protein